MDEEGDSTAEVQALRVPPESKDARYVDLDDFLWSLLEQWSLVNKQWVKRLAALYNKHCDVYAPNEARGRVRLGKGGGRSADGRVPEAGSCVRARALE